ncbi:MAG: hypothetical protein FWC23_04700 [Chitinispirillia bacterium]|nr:hypothetical protein [Chitinispirillia bacterium]MCL2268467.1 hypothetical protein [Chitinispirillia bacterium]
MDIIKELLAPIPIPALILTAFGLIFGWMLSRFLRMPPGFNHTQEVREEIRYRILGERLANEAAEAAELAKTEGKKPADGAATETAPPAPPAPAAEGDAANKG